MADTNSSAVVAAEAAESSHGGRGGRAQRRRRAGNDRSMTEEHVSAQPGSSLVAAGQAVADGASVSTTREACREALRRYHGAAIALADELARQNPGYTVAINLAAGLHQAAGSEARDLVIRRGDKESVAGEKEAVAVAARHFSSAILGYNRVVRLASRFITTASARAKVLAASQKFDLAHEEFLRAMAISVPDDPSDHNVGYDLRRRWTSGELHRSTTSMRKDRAKAELQKQVRAFRETICTSYIPRQATFVWEAFKSGSGEPDAISEARDQAEHLVYYYPFCPRAHLLFGKLELEMVRNSDGDGELESVRNSDGVGASRQVSALGQVLKMMSKAASAFPKSGVISLVRAEVCYLLKEYDATARECCRALQIRRPDDPGLQDIPIGSTTGSDPDARINTIRILLQELLGKVTSETPTTPDGVDSPAMSFSKDSAPPVSAKPGSETTVSAQDTHALSGNEDLEEPAMVADLIMTAKKQTLPIHFARGRYIDEGVVNLYKEYCIALSQCSEKRTVCHLCCFEGVYCPKILKGNMNVHFHNEHWKGKETVNCDEKIATPASELMLIFVCITTLYIGFSQAGGRSHSYM
ncbi:uncharacterized protein LOC104585508 [Brachypodium distachyon]|uniref:DUF629 domain-containing protein n=1 Tax=Brachypodium distachyon TaxID=15368 RepID=I1IW95_BRADI|nr:uncharacterized protein LOC104585508 [Brachypodium distachyon]PNT60697.1 hypothetical protein BRADI_5g03436v3 [Brachypodium distachyon]|eukprot:XP_024311988.1 uncharacterized protein LOC104585508 [Brachypodium distachyon]